MSQLTFGVFVAVQAQLGVKGEVTAEFQEERAEIAVERVDVVVVHHRSGSHNPWIRCTSLRVPALLGAKHRGFFLGFADEHHALMAGKLAEMFGHHIVFALSLPKLHERDIPACGEGFQRRHEAAAHRTHQRCRRDRLAPVLAEEPYNPLFGLQPRHIDVEIHPVDALHRQLHMIAENIRHTLCYHRRGSGRSGFAS